MDTQCPTSVGTHKLVEQQQRSWTSRHPYVALMLVGLSSVLLIGLAAFLGAI